MKEILGNLLIYKLLRVNILMLSNFFQFIEFMFPSFATSYFSIFFVVLSNRIKIINYVFVKYSFSLKNECM